MESTSSVTSSNQMVRAHTLDPTPDAPRSHNLLTIRLLINDILHINIQSGAILKAEEFDENILEEAIVKTSPLRPLPICFYNSEGQSIR